jgi:ribosomal protein S27AE
MSYLEGMPRNKIDLQKVLAAMDTTCPECGCSITPAEIQRVDFERMRCPKCGQVFDAAKVRKAD